MHVDDDRLSGESTRAGVMVIRVVIALMLMMLPAMQSLAQEEPAETGVQEKSEPFVQLGRTIDDFTLQDYLGTEHSLSDFSKTPVIVIAFLGTECPLAKLYAAQLATLSQRYDSQEVAFIGINSNVQDTPTELGHFARKHVITFPLLKDPGNRIADVFRAERTPEVFVLDSNRTVRYRGRIDDQFGVGYSRPAAKENYLVSALDELIVGKQVSTPKTEPVGCHIGRVTKTAPTGDITYTNQVSRLMERRCVECHRDGGIAPLALRSYRAVSAWAETICEVIEDQRMPPWHANPKFGHFANEARMTDDEKALLYQWVENGTPKGSAEDLPPQRDFPDGWVLGEPDLVLTMPEPITVTPTGVVDYQYVTVDPGFTEGKWVRASEIRPGVRTVVHHIIVFINTPGADPILEERGVGFETVGGYVPGSPPMDLPDGVARYVPPGSTFVFQIHYTPDGTERKDRSQIGLYFADAKAVRKTMQTGVVVNLDFNIPANADNHRVVAAHRFSHDMEIYSLSPHMHYRGKSFRFEATYPNGSREILLDVPRYDFNWQNVYKFDEPKFIPEGTMLRCVAHFDNSEKNLSNPDPTIAVRWGEQTWDEMMLGYFEGVFLNQDLTLPEPEFRALGGDRYRAQFTYKPDRPAKTINVAGTFNDWNNTTHGLTDEDRDGIYTIDVIVRKGEHRYKFVIDGQYWTHDPASRILTGFMHDSFFAVGP
jgi:peroxiredoxin